MPRLACQTRVETLNAEAITIEPLATLPAVKDLVVDLGPFFAKWKKVRPALHPKNKDSKELAIVRPDSEFGKQAQVKRDCITCGACYSVCGIVGSNEDYLGPAAINRAMLRLLDPRDGNVDDRLAVLNDETGVWRCHTQFNCVAACPKNINLTDSIMKMKRSLLFPKRFRDKWSAKKAVLHLQKSEVFMDSDQRATRRLTASEREFAIVMGATMLLASFISLITSIAMVIPL